MLVSGYGYILRLIVEDSANGIKRALDFELGLVFGKRYERVEKFGSEGKRVIDR